MRPLPAYPGAASSFSAPVAGARSLSGRVPLADKPGAAIGRLATRVQFLP
jgi:hypothetical protein